VIPDCLGPREVRARAGWSVPAGAWDTHFHVLGPQARFPYAATRKYTPPDAPLAQSLVLHDALGIARSNVSNSIRELLGWDLIRSVPVLRDRRTFYVAETDLWTLVSRIAAGRKARELDPAAAALRECVEAARNDAEVSPVAARRLQEMLDFVERTSRWYDQMIKLPRAQITALMKLGAGVVRLLGPRGAKRNEGKVAIGGRHE